jgi:hypothetical protein
MQTRYNNPGTRGTWFRKCGVPGGVFPTGYFHDGPVLPGNQEREKSSCDY